MKKLICILSALLATEMAAQNVGINPGGSTPNASSILDLNTGNTYTNPNGKGLLIPNLALTSTAAQNPVTSPATSLLVYNTATASTGSTAVYPGYYYWDGTKWVAMAGNGSNNWALIGNGGTTPSSAAIGAAVNNNFIGTTDANAFVIATSNLERVRVSSGGYVGISQVSPGAKLSFNDLNDGTNGADGITWYSPAPTAYGIFRSAGAWAGPNYQQLTLNWETGVIINGGSLYGQSGTILQPGAGNVGIGTGTTPPRTNSGTRLDINGAIDIGTFGGLNSVPTTYGSLGITLAKNGYYGLLFGQTTAHPNYMYDGAGNGGIYFENWGWLQYMTVGNHFTGYGLNNTAPGYLMDIGDRIRLRAGGAGSAGMWFFNGTSDIGFFGDVANGHLGWFGSGYGWGMVMNTSTGNIGIGNTGPSQKLDVTGNVQFSGALMPAGNPGTADQTLLSRGAGLSPVWGWATAGQQFATVYSTAQIALNNGSATTLIPGLSQTINIPVNGTYDMYIFTDGGCALNTGGINQGEQLEISIWVDGVAVRYITSIVQNPSNYISGINNWATSGFINGLAAGAHTVEVFARNRGSAGIQIVVAATNAVGNYLRASLSVGLVKK